MERLTYKAQGNCGFVWAARCPGASMQDVIDRLAALAAYEDAMPIERAQELARAETDGRLVVLPVPVGTDKVAYGFTDPEYGPRCIETIECGHLERLEIWDNPGHEVVIEADGWEIGESDIGKTVFLTREEAEAALKKRGGRKTMRLIDADALREIVEGELRNNPHTDGYARSCHRVEYAHFLDVICRMPTIAPPPNDPLTLEELREMDGEPVWIVQINGELRPFWGLVDVEDESAANRLYAALFEDYGAEWLAYRRKPEEAAP